MSYNSTTKLKEKSIKIMTKTIGYKAMNPDMTCRGFQFEVGKTYKVDNDNPLSLCSNSGFHFCLDLEDVFAYYDYDNCRLFEIETESEVLTEGNKSITKTITIKRELTKKDLSQYKFRQKHLNIFFRDLTEEIFSKHKDSKYFQVRSVLVKKLEDLNLMFKTFKDDRDEIVRRTVVEKMTDYDLMLKTFKYDVSSDVRTAVVKKMTNLGLMFRIFKNDKSYVVCRAVVNKMTDLDLMYNTFKDDEDSFVRRAVVYKMKDLDLMYNTFKSDKSQEVRQFVREKMNMK